MPDPRIPLIARYGCTASDLALVESAAVNRSADQLRVFAAMNKDVVSRRAAWWRGTGE